IPDGTRSPIPKLPESPASNIQNARQSHAAPIHSRNDRPILRLQPLDASFSHGPLHNNPLPSQLRSNPSTHQTFKLEDPDSPDTLHAHYRYSLLYCIILLRPSFGASPRDRLHTSRTCSILSEVEKFAHKIQLYYLVVEFE